MSVIIHEVDDNGLQLDQLVRLFPLKLVWLIRAYNNQILIADSLSKEVTRSSHDHVASYISV